MPPAASHKQGVKSWGNQPNQKLTGFFPQRKAPLLSLKLHQDIVVKHLKVFFKDQGKKKEKKNQSPAPLDFSEVPNLVRIIFTCIIVLACSGVLGNYLVERVHLSRI